MITDVAGRDGYLTIHKSDLSGSWERLELQHYQAGGILAADIRKLHSSVQLFCAPSILT
jgi:hypothetical protein